LALNAGEWFRRGRLLMCCSPANTGSILAHRSSLSTFSRVQFCAATSLRGNCSRFCSATNSEMQRFFARRCQGITQGVI
ncbi:MAG: hypothetical protein ACK54C_09840, partial [Betaproteobacteria bacterium]